MSRSCVLRRALAGVGCSLFAVLASLEATPIEEATIASLHAAYRSSETTVAAVTAAHLARIAAYDQRGPYLNSIINVNPHAASEAVALDAHFKKTGQFVGPLHGVPVIVKDCIDAAGMPMTSGFQGWKKYYPPTDAPLVAKIKAAGGIILAKASLSEFTRGGGDNINSVLGGFARNPYNTAYSTGGSSGGTGASIAASFAVLGIGTDTGGSVRMPSAHNALAGLRPTVGLVSRTGITPNNSIRDTAGPMTRSVADLAILLDVISGPDAADPVTAKATGKIPATFTAGLDKNALRGARLGVLRQVFTPGVTDPLVLAHFEKTLAELRAAGAEIVDTFTIPGFDDIPRPPQTAARFKADMEAFLAARPGMPYGTLREIVESKLLHPLHQQLFETSLAARPASEDPATIEGLKNEARYRELFTAAMDAARIDALVFPVWAQLPAINGDRNTVTGSAAPKTGGRQVTRTGASLTFVASSLQWPALSVPSGYVGENLPQGLQILGRAWDDAKIIRYAFAYEQSTKHRVPPPTTPPLAESFSSR